jgi:hypothetical protein
MKTKMTQNFYIISALLFAACNDTTNNITTDQQSDSSKTKSDNLVIVKSDKLEVPSSLLFDLTKYIDSLGFSYDTTRIKKVRYFNNKDCFFYNDKAFYKLNPNSTLVFTTKKSIIPLSNVDTSTIKYELFKKVLSVYGYYYCDKNKTTDLIEDGAIEEWTFPTEKEADDAGVEINRIKFGVYFHTAAYIARQKNVIYIFHNRAAFEHIYKQTIKHFEKRFGIIYPFYEPARN